MGLFARMLAAKADQWEREALMLCAAHGRAGGRFDVYRWCNGKLMAEPAFTDGREALPNQCISVEALNELRRNGWQVIVQE